MSTSSRIFVAVLFAVLISYPVMADTHNAPTCNYQDVAAAVAAAARNDTVSVPATGVGGGTCIWNQELELTKGITLTGAGVGQTVITSGGGAESAGNLIWGNPDTTAIDNSEIIKVTGFTFDGANAACPIMALHGASGITGTKPYMSYVIGDNKFQNGCTSSTEGVLLLRYQLRGVIYNNVFDRVRTLLRAFGSDDTDEWENTAFNQFAYGSADNIYFENNTIQYSSSFNAGDPGWIEIGQGSRLVARYNTWNFANTGSCTNCELWDSHGFQNWDGTPDSGQTGTMLVEYYGNTISNGHEGGKWSNHRGSWGLFFNNSFTGIATPPLHVSQYAGGCPGLISPSPTYNPVVNNTYAFNNVGNGTIENMEVNGAVGAGCGIAENSNWWNYNASCTASSCTAGIGRGTTAPTGSCTNGTAYWVASTATPTTSSSVIQAGKLYKCSGGSWGASPYYTPYTHPHPLRAEATTANLWIDTNGGTCTRSATPAAYSDAAACASFTAAYNAASGGDTIYVRAGTYGAQDVPVRSLGTSYVTISAEPGATVNTGEIVIHTNYITINGFHTGNNQIGVESIENAGETACLTHHITISNNHLQGVKASIGAGCYDIAIIGNEIAGTNVCVSGGFPYNEDSIVIVGPGGWGKYLPHNITIRGNYIHDMGTADGTCGAHADAIQMSGCHDCVIEDNIFNNVDTSSLIIYETEWRPSHDDNQNIVVQNNSIGTTLEPGHGLSIGGSVCFTATNIIVQNNTFWTDAGIDMNCDDGTPAGTIRNNIFVQDPGYVCGSNVNAIDYNVFPVGVTGCGTHKKSCTVSFVDGAHTGGNVDLNSGDTCAKDYAPTTAGTYPAADMHGTTRPAGAGVDAGAYEIAGAGTAPTITTAAGAISPTGTVGTAYSFTFTATGDTPITWEVTSGALPSGLQLGLSTGAITGTPLAAETGNFTVKATNATGNNSKAFSLTINPAGPVPTITSLFIDEGTEHVAYSFTFTATNTPTSWNQSGLPVWASWNSTTGTITAADPIAGVYPLIITATNGNGSSSPSNLDFTVYTVATSHQATKGDVQVNGSVVIK